MRQSPREVGGSVRSREISPAVVRAHAFAVAGFFSMKLAAARRTTDRIAKRFGYVSKSLRYRTADGLVKLISVAPYPGNRIATRSGYVTCSPRRRATDGPVKPLSVSPFLGRSDRPGLENVPDRKSHVVACIYTLPANGTLVCKTLCPGCRNEGLPFDQGEYEGCVAVLTTFWSVRIWLE